MCATCAHAPAKGDGKPRPESRESEGQVPSLVMRGQSTTTIPQAPLQSDNMHTHVSDENIIMRQFPQNKTLELLHYVVMMISHCQQMCEWQLGLQLGLRLQP